MNYHNLLLQQLLDSLAFSGVSPVIFSADEVYAWPDGTVDLFLQLNFLQKAEPAQIVVCPGCEENCLMEVNIRPKDGTHSARAFTVCNKRDDIGSVELSFDKLKRWKMTGALLAKTVSGLLKLIPPAKVAQKSQAWDLGTFVDKQYRGQISLLIDGGVFLMVSGHKIPIMEVIHFDEENRLSVNNALLLSCIKKPVKAKAISTRREERKKETQKQHASWQKAYVDLKKKHSDKSDAWCAEKISKLPIANGKSAETIRRNMKK